MSFNRYLNGIIIVITLFVVGANTVLHYLADDNLARGWPSNVVRNWQQFGLVTLHGKMVTNPGGFEALTNPQVYKGHSPVSLYPAYLVKRLGGALAGQGN